MSSVSRPSLYFRPPLTASYGPVLYCVANYERGVGLTAVGGGVARSNNSL